MICIPYGRNSLKDVDFLKLKPECDINAIKSFTSVFVIIKL